MVLSDFGEIAHAEWLKLPSHFSNVELDVFQIMPNHMHAIIILTAPSKALSPGDPGVGQEEEDPSKAGADGLSKAGVSPANTVPNPSDDQASVKVGLAPTVSSSPVHPCSSSPTSTVSSSPTSTVSSSPSVSQSPVPLSVAPQQAEGIADETDTGQPFVSSARKKLYDIIGSYKSRVANACLKAHKQKYSGSKHIPRLGKIWLRSFYDIIIRDVRAYNAISRYILNNPKNWTRDKFNRK